jgi:hypothetical protein
MRFDMSKTVIQVIVNENDITDIKTIEIPATAFQALNFKRVDFVKFKEYDVSKPGIYLLLGQNDNEITKLYIGETTNLKDRLKYHYLNKDFWSEAIVFYSKNNEISSSHIKYVEAKLISMVNKDIEIELDNNKTQFIPTIDGAGEIIANKYLENFLFLLSALRFDYFINKNYCDNNLDNFIIFEFKRKNALGKMIRKNGKYFILRGSTAIIDENNSTSKHIINIRKNLVKKGVMRKDLDKNLYKVMEDIPVNTSSRAAWIIAGHNASGPQSWKYNNKTLKQIEEEEVK